jgi:hypothetical protein
MLRLLWWAATVAGLLVNSGPSYAAGVVLPQPYVWRNVRIGGGGFVSGVVFHPAARNLVYARTDVGGAFRWDPDQNSWIPLNDMLGQQDASLLGVVSLAVDAGNPNLVYLACGQYTRSWEKHHAAILWSIDQGRTWSRAALPFKLGGNEDGRSVGERLQADPNDGGILFLGTNQDGLWTSTGHRPGLWNRVDGFPANSVTLVLFDRRSSQPGRPTPTLYVGASGRNQGLYCSHDGGKTWAAVPGQPGGLIPQHAGLDDRGTLYLAYANRLGPNGITDGGVWKFEPAAGIWADISPLKPGGEDRFGYAGLALDAQRPGTLLVTTLDRWKNGDEIFRSPDGGTTWTGLRAKAAWDHSPAPYTAKLKPHWMGDIDIDPFDSSHAIVVTGYGVWTCTNLTAADSGGATCWIFQDEGLEESVPSALVSPPVGAPLISSLYDIAGFRHDVLDVSPPRGAFDAAFRNCYSVDFAEKRPAQLVLTHAGGAQRGSYSLDGGTTWTSFASSPRPDGSRLVWLPRGAPPFYSIDNGTTWSRSRGGPTAVKDHRITRPTADRENPRKFYIYDLAKGRLWVSTDGGATFDRAAATLPAAGGTLACVFGREGDLWLPTGAGLYHSVNSGGKFTRLAAVRAAYQVGFGRAAPGRDYPAIYLFGKVNNEEGVFRSDDAGKSWVAISDHRHRFGWISTVIGDPRTFGRVYLGTGGRGIIYGDPEPGAPQP